MSDDYIDGERVFDEHTQQTYNQIVDLNEDIIRLKSKMAGEEFPGLNPEAARHIVDLSKMIIALKTKIAFLENKIKKYESIPIPGTVKLQILELERDNRKLQADVDYYKEYVPAQIIINRESKDKPTRRGGLK